MRVTLIVTGAVSAAHLPMYASWLRRNRGDQLQQILLTPTAETFVAPLALKSISNVPVVTDSWQSFQRAGLHHVELGEANDVLLVYPATVNYLVRVAQLSFDSPSTAAIASGTSLTVLCPALPPRIADHPLYQDAEATISKVARYRIIPPVVGESLASATPGHVPPPLWDVWPQVERMVSEQ